MTGNPTSPASGRAVVALFVTCVVDQALPDVGVATVRLLRRAGYEVAFPTAQTCCGQPFFNSGFHQEAARLARHTIEVLEPFETVVVPGGSCTAMIRVEYPHLLADDPSWGERARALALKTFELSEFLSHTGEIVNAVPAADDSVTYHDSCHMCRLLGLREEPRSLLRAAGCAVEEMAESDRCCGFGGLFSVRLPEIANAMSREKWRQAVETGAGTLVTADPGCLLQLRGLAPEGMRVVHLASLLEERSR